MVRDENISLLELSDYLNNAIGKKIIVALLVRIDYAYAGIIQNEEGEPLMFAYEIFRTFNSYGQSNAEIEAGKITRKRLIDTIETLSNCGVVYTMRYQRKGYTKIEVKPIVNDAQKILASMSNKDLIRWQEE